MNNAALTIKSHPENLKHVRSFIRRSAEKCGFQGQDIDCIVLAVDEACANIIRHAYGGDYTKDMIVSANCNENELIIILKDYGKKPDLNKLNNPPQEKLRKGKYGVVFIRKIMDEVFYDISSKDITTLRLIKHKKNL